MTMLYQEWRDLLFLHWKQSAQEIQKTLPAGLTVDTFEGDAYVTLIPFLMPKASIASKLTIPGLNNFLEVNFRTYVRDENNNAGIWFYSLDINSHLASMVGRTLFHLPYRYAKLSVTGSNKRRYQMQRGFDAHYHLNRNILLSSSNHSLSHFLVERYRLFSQTKHKLFTQEVRHKPYPLCAVTLIDFVSQKRQFPDSRPFDVHFSPGVDVEILPMKEI